MSHNLQKPTIYLITSGETNLQTTPATDDFLKVLKLIEGAVSAGIDLVQIREKNLSSRVLFQLASSAAKIAEGSDTRVLVNDRADIAAAAGVEGVHLTTHSLSAEIIRRTFGNDFLIGVSTHSAGEAVTARANGADFVVFGPVFETPSKSGYREPAGLDQLREVAAQVAGWPVLALGGVNLERVRACLEAGAQGVAAIRLFSDPAQLKETVNAIREKAAE